MDTEAILLLRDFGMHIHKTIDYTLTEKFTLNKHELKLLHYMSFEEYVPLSQKQLAELIYADRSTMVNVVDNLERLNYIKRQQNPDNRRENLLLLTDEGVFLNKQIIKAIENGIKDKFNDIEADDMEIFKKVLRQILKEDNVNES